VKSNNEEISHARRCAQIKQIIKLSKCEHPEDAEEFMLGINGNWITYCTICDKVLDRG